MFPQKIIREGIEEGLRFSGRNFLERRPVKVECGPGEGQVSVFLGDTWVVGEVVGEVVMPMVENPNEGKVSVTVTCSQISDPSARRNARKTGLYLSSVLERLIQGSRVLDLSSLCILSGKSVWSLKLNMMILRDAGNLLDACSIALMAMISHFRRSDFTLQGQNVILHSATERDPVYLPILHKPLLITYGIVDIEQESRARVDESDAENQIDSKWAIINDPDEYETPCLAGTLTIAMNPSGEICLIEKVGGASLPLEQFNFLLPTVVPHVQQTAEIIAQAIETSLKEQKRIQRRRATPTPTDQPTIALES